MTDLHGSNGRKPIRPRSSFLSPLLRRGITLGYLLAIYASLGIVRPIAEQLRAAGLLRLTVYSLLGLGTVALLWWRHRDMARARLAWRILLIALLVLISLLFPGLPEEKLHFLTYGLLGWLLCWSMESDFPTPRTLLTALALAWSAGTVDELIQWYLPSRIFDLRDIFFNGVAGTAGIAFYCTGSGRQAIPGNEPPRT